MLRATLLSLLFSTFSVAWAQEAPLGGARDAQDAPTGQVEVLTLERAIALAEQNNRQIKIASQEVDKANAAVLASRTARLPQFHLNFLGGGLLTPLRFTYDQGVLGNVNGSPVPSTNTDITTSRQPFAFVTGEAIQPISQIYRINLGIQEQEIAAKLAAEALRAQRQQTIQAVRSDYYKVLQTESSIEAAEATTKMYRELDRTTDQYVLARTALKYQSLNVKTQLAKAELDLVTLQDTLASQKEQLSALVGRDVLTDFSIGGVPEETGEEIDIVAARQRALANRSEVRQASLKIAMATNEERAQKSRYIPDVSFAFNYFSFFNSQVIPRNVVTAGVLVNWDIFDWGYKRHLLEERKHDTAESRLNLTEAETQVVVDASAHFRSLKEARARLKVAQLAQEAEKEKLRVVLEQYQQKSALLTDAFEEQKAWTQANTSYQQALAVFWTARAEFEKSIGED
ncbi:MAG: TolC family protein [Candidatus Acidiferrales bacterium]